MATGLFASGHPARSTTARSGKGQPQSGRQAALPEVVEILDDHDHSRDDQEDGHGHQDFQRDSPERHTGDGEGDEERQIRRRRYRGERSEGMLCSLAELGWDSSEADRVALLDAAANLGVGESLNDRYVDWQRIVLRADDSLGAEHFPAANHPRVPQLTE